MCVLIKKDVAKITDKTIFDMSFTQICNRFSRLTFLFLLALFLNFTNSFAEDAPKTGGDVAKGEELFKGNCTTCHAVQKQVVGPALKDITKRRDITWIKKFVRNSQKVIKVEKDPYAVALYTKFGGTEMTAFSSFKDDEIEAIVAYITAESSKAPEAGPVTTAGTGGSTQAAPQNDYSDLILLLTIVTLVLVAITLVVFITVIRKYLKDREDKLAEEDQEIVNQKFDLSAVVKSKLFITTVSVVFIAVALKACWVGTLGVGVEQNYQPKQPIPFSHKQHAGQFKIDCGYCHTGVYKGKQSNIPGVNICMNCHSQIKSGPRFGTEGIASLIKHYNENRPIQWVRVHNLPDLAYFNHSQHTVAGGIECTTCHGQIDTMEVVHQHANLTMGWCINCHRETAVNGKDNAYYDKLLLVHEKKGIKGNMTVAEIGGLECSKCHY